MYYIDFKYVQYLIMIMMQFFKKSLIKKPV